MSIRSVTFSITDSNQKITFKKLINNVNLTPKHSFANLLSRDFSQKNQSKTSSFWPFDPHSGGEWSLGETKYTIGDSYTVGKVWATTFRINWRKKWPLGSFSENAEIAFYFNPQIIFEVTIKPLCDYTFRAGPDLMWSSSWASNSDDFPFFWILYCSSRTQVTAVWKSVNICWNGVGLATGAAHVA